MRDLHVYVDSVGSGGRGEQSAFIASLQAQDAGGAARWEAVPTTLRDRLGEHYLE